MKTEVPSTAVILSKEGRSRLVEPPGGRGIRIRAREQVQERHTIGEPEWLTLQLWSVHAANVWGERALL